MTQEMILAIVRHGLTFAGGILAKEGIISGDETTTGTAAIMTLIGIVWSGFRKWKRAQTPAA